MEKFSIIGGKRLNGELQIDTSKNAILPIIAATILTEKEVVLKKVPFISDVKKMLEMIRQIGGSVKIDGDTVTIKNESINCYEIPTALASEIRSSIFMMGPLLARFKSARVPYPGGCDIGSRPIDLHLFGLKELKVKVVEDYGYINCDGKNMKSSCIHLDFPSVGATENLMMASVFLKGETTIYNVAKEPEIVDLQNFINALGGNVQGAGTSTIKIKGVKKLANKVEYTPISDRIVTGTYLIAVAMAKGKLRLTNANFESVFSLINKLRKSGCKIELDSGTIEIECNTRLLSCSFETQPYPGFPTDLQPQLSSLQTICKGTAIVTENLFETRFKHFPELTKMGAKITTKDRTAIIKGVSRLYGADVVAHDLRGGAALVLAGLCAKGKTVVDGINYVDRGYFNLEEKLSSVGAEISRLKQ